MNIKMILWVLSLYVININSSFERDVDQKLKAYSKVNPEYYKIFERRRERERADNYQFFPKNDDSPLISKDLVPTELLEKVLPVFRYINTLESYMGEFLNDKWEFHELNAKIAQPFSSPRRKLGHSTEERYREMGNNTTLTEKQLKVITEWFNERYAAIKDRPNNMDAIKLYEELRAKERAQQELKF